MSLAGQKPSGKWQFAEADKPSKAGGMLGEIVTGLPWGDWLGGAGDWIGNLFGGGTGGGITSGGSLDLGSNNGGGAWGGDYSGGWASDLGSSYGGGGWADTQFDNYYG